MWRAAILLASAVFSLSAAEPCQAEKRVALVIGNSAYQHAPELANPKNDAADIAAALKTLGFEVITGIDLDKPGMDRAIREFSATLSGAAVGTFFYAGHGLAWSTSIRSPKASRPRCRTRS